MEWVALLLFLTVILLLLVGFPVAFSLGGTAMLFALFGVIGGGFESAFLAGLPSRIFGIMTNETLIAVPLFVNEQPAYDLHAAGTDQPRV